ncbi:MAG: hypothetical protein EG825_15955 [Rhodocyclaceae bacterium]|nr:hypothetical protein [Rhodocyclaceae bacterium]
MKLGVKVMIAGLGLSFMALVQAADMLCVQECTRSGQPAVQCMMLCDGGSNSGGATLPQQPGSMQNPYFDAVKPKETQRAPLPPLVDQRCLDDCRAKSYSYRYCRSFCSSYSPY